MTVTTAPIWQDLVGASFAHGGRGPSYDCLGIVLEVQRRVGYDVRDPVEAYRDGKAGHDFQKAWCGSWKITDRPRIYDAVLMQFGARYHVGVIVEPDRILHAHHTRGVVVERLAAFAEGQVLGFWTPTGDLTPNPDAPHIAPGDPTGGVAVTFLGMAVFEGLSATAAGLLVAAGNALIATGLGLLIQAIAAPSAPKLEGPEEGRPTFSLAGSRNTVQNGTTIPVVYGEHRVGGQIIGLFFRADATFRTRLYMLICDGQGEYQSIAGKTVDADNLPASAFTGRDLELNGNPISGFPKARVSVRMGTLTQSPIPGFEETVTAGSVNQTLHRTATPGVYNQIIAENVDTITYTTTTVIDAFEINLQFPDGLYKQNTTGDTEGYETHMTLRYRRKGIASSEVAELLIIGPDAIRADHSRTIRRENLTSDIYEISLTRSALEDKDTQRRHSVTVWTSVNEIDASQALAYPGLALKALEIPAEQVGGQIPVVTSLDKGRKVPVWDGVSTTSPAFTMQWSDNAAWCALDMMTNAQFGGGNFITLNAIDLTSLKVVADYNDTTITTDGTSHARWQFDYVFDVASNFWESVQLIFSSCRSSVTMLGSKYFFRPDTTASYSQVFGMGNVLKGSYRETYIDTTTQANFVEVQYLNRDTNWDQDVAQLHAATSSSSIKRATARIPGLTRAVHAYRAAKYMLNFQSNVTRKVAFEAPVDAIAVIPGDVFRMSHDVMSTVHASGRITATTIVNLTTIKLKFDRPITVSGSFTFLFRSSAAGSGGETFLTNTTATPGTYTAGTDITFTAAVTSDEVPAPGDLYMCGATSTYYKDWRCIRKTLRPDFVCAVEGIEYVADVYSDDPGAIETFTDAYPDSRLLPDAPTSLHVADSETTAKDGTVQHELQVDFKPSRTGLTHDVWYRYCDDTDTDRSTDGIRWIYAGCTKDNTFRFPASAYKRAVMVSVSARSGAGMVADADAGAIVPFAVQGKTTAPGVPTSLVATLVDSKVWLTWTAPTDADVAYYEIRASADSARWIFAMPIATARQTSAVVEPSLYGTAKYYLVKAVNRSGIPSATCASVSVTPSSGGLVTILDASVVGGGSIDWTSGTLSNCSKVATNLRTDAAASSATWTSATTSFPILSQQATIRCHLDAVAYDLASTMAEMGWRGDSTAALRTRASGEMIDYPWPEQPTIFDAEAKHGPSALAVPATAPIAKVVTLSGTPYPWSSNFAVLIEYDLATDTGGTTWDGYKTYTGPIEAKARYYVRWRITFTIANAEYQIECTGLYVQITANGATYLGRDDQIVIDDDFDNGSTESGELGGSGLNTSGTSSTFAVVAADENHWGVVSIATQTTTGNFAGASTAQNIFYPNARTYAKLTAWVKPIDSASVAYYIGFAQNTGSATPSRRIWLTATAGGNWAAANTDASSTKTTNTGIALSTNWWKLEIEVFGVSSIKYTLYDQGAGTSATVTHTENIPTDLAMLLTFQVGNSTGSAKTLYLDRYRLQMSGLRRL